MLTEISWHPLELAGVHVRNMDALYPMQWLTFRRESSMCWHVACIPLSQEDRQVNMDYALVHAMQHGMDPQQKVITFYDINCQYNKNLKRWLEANNFISLPRGLWIQPSIGLWHVCTWSQGRMFHPVCSQFHFGCRPRRWWNYGDPLVLS